MGGDWYDREVLPVAQDVSYSAQAEQAMMQTTTPHQLLSPFQRGISCRFKNPIVVSIDVTGSMGNWAKIIWDKMPMFIGQIKLKNYLLDPGISFCAVGDAYSDTTPLQVCEFATGNELDDWVSRIYLEGGGGDGISESYELAAYYYAKHCSFVHPDDDLTTDENIVKKGFFFFLGDENFYSDVNGVQIEKLISGEANMPTFATKDIFEALQKKFEVFYIHKQHSLWNEGSIISSWGSVIPKERILVLHNAKACVDVMLAVIATMSGTSLTEYIEDMRSRGQTEERIQEVRIVLNNLWNVDEPVIATIENLACQAKNIILNLTEGSVGIFGSIQT